MVIDELGEYVCRTATLEDIEGMYEVLEPLVCDHTRFKYQLANQQRQLKNLLKFHIEKKDSMVVVKNEEIVGAYVGDGNFILYLANKRKDLKAMVLLMYNVLCVIHNKFRNSEFVPLKHEDSYKYRQSMFGKTIIQEENGKSYINSFAKEKIEYLYNRIKNEPIYIAQ